MSKNVFTILEFAESLMTISNGICSSQERDFKVVKGRGKKRLKTGGGDVNPQSPQKILFFVVKEKKTQNVLKRINKENYFVTFLQGYEKKIWKFFPIFS